MKQTNYFLIAGGVMSVSLTILHIAIILGGPAWYLFFGAGEEMASLAQQGSLIPGLVTFGISIIFFVWGLYAFSGAGAIRPLPLLKLALVVIPAIFLMRGLGVIPLYFVMPHSVDGLIVWSSIVSSTIGFVYVAGVWRAWPRIS